MVSFSDIIAGREYVGLSEGYPVSELLNIFGQPDSIDEFVASRQKNYIYKDLQIVIDPNEKVIFSFVIYGKGKCGRFVLPDIITESEFIHKESTIIDLANIFRTNNINFDIVDRDGDKYMKISNGEIVFFQYIEGVYNIYGIYLSRI